MIIGNNSNNSFKHNPINYNTNNTQKEFNSTPNQNHYNNPLNKNEMADKTYQMLEERFTNNAINYQNLEINEIILLIYIYYIRRNYV